MATEGPGEARRILYFGDPMCSWCYGFAPAAQAIASRYADRVPVQLVLGGLRAGTTEPMDDRRKAVLRRHWAEVHAATGQPFDLRLFDRDDFVYDSEPACRAVVTVRMIAPALTFPYFARLQRAFYAEGHDITRADELARPAAAMGIDAAAFATMFAGEAARLATAGDFRLCLVLGVNEFPSVVLQEGTRYAYLTCGYRPFEQLSPLLDAWVDARSG